MLIVYFFFSEVVVRKDELTKAEKAIMWIALIMITLVCFSKLSIDAIILGAIAIYLYQSSPKPKRKLAL